MTTFNSMEDIITSGNKYNIIYLDPPWLYNARKNPNTKFGLGMHRYPGMTLTEMIALHISDIAADNCAILMWHVPPKFIEYSIHTLFLAWGGFRYITKAFTWVKISKEGKPRLLPGNYTGSNTEDCFLGIKGRMTVQNKGVNQVIISELEQHSKKPDEVRTRIVQLFGDIPRIELFSRETHPGWDVMGNQVTVP